MDTLMTFEHLALALAIGLLIGTERGWHEREAVEGRRVAGIRTFALVGLLGGVTGLLGQQLGPVTAGLGWGGFALLVAAAYWRESRDSSRRIGMTTEVALLLAFSLGLLALMGHAAVAAASAVVATVLLGLKPELHGWLQRIEAMELKAALKLLLISVVILPILPNQGYGPWEALNPYAIWWMVVLVSGISFVGYFAVKLAGARLGMLLTGLVGGLASSTAVTLSFARLYSSLRDMPRVFAAGILAASAIMFPRVLLEVYVVNAALLPAVLPPFLLMMTVTLIAAGLFWRQSQAGVEASCPQLRNPFELGTALKFGLLLAAIMLLAKAMTHWFGDYGIYVLALLSGITDVDAITLSLSGMAGDSVSQEVAARGITLAALVNTLVKAGMALFIGGLALGARVGLVALGVAAIGGITVLMVS